MKPICVKCQRFYQPETTGVAFIEAMPSVDCETGRSAVPGSSHRYLWTPYKLWMGDLWKCQGCGRQLIVGVGQNPISEHYKPDFKEQIQRESALRGIAVQVNDC